MTTLIIFLAIIAIWWISGFARAIKPKNNRFHAWGPFNQIWGWIDGDKPTFIPYSMPWPFHAIYRPLTYTKYVEDGRIEAHEEMSADGKKIKYHTATVIKGIKNPIRHIDEEVNRLRKIEIHPYLVTVSLPLSASTFYLSFTAKIKIIDPMLTLKLDNFLSFFGNELSDAVSPWAVEKEKRSLDDAEKNSSDNREKADVILDSMLGLKVDDANCIIIKINQRNPDGSTSEIEMNLIDYMNMKIKPFGMKNDEFSLEVGYDKNVEDILNKRIQQKIQEEQTKLEENASKTRDVVRAREKANIDQEIELAKKELNEVQKPALDALGDMRAKANNAWKEGTTVFSGSSDQSNVETALLAGILNNIKKGDKNEK